MVEMMTIETYAFFSKTFSVALFATSPQRLTGLL